MQETENTAYQAVTVRFVQISRFLPIMVKLVQHQHVLKLFKKMEAVECVETINTMMMVRRSASKKSVMPDQE